MLPNHSCIETKMFLTPEELENLLLTDWEEIYYNMFKVDVLKLRAARIKDLDGKDTAKLYRWPKGIRKLIFTLPPHFSQRQEVALFVFLIGNGCSVYRTGTWLLTYHALTEWEMRNDLCRKMIQSLVSLYRKMRMGEADHLTYFDLDEQRIKSIRDSAHLSGKSVKIEDTSSAQEEEEEIKTDETEEGETEEEVEDGEDIGDFSSMDGENNFNDDIFN